MIVELTLAQMTLERLAATPVAYAEVMQLPPSFVMDHAGSISYWANLYGVSAYELDKTIECESGYAPSAVNPLSGATGLVQILPSAHREITKEQMLDPDWSVQWMAQNWKAHKAWWVCARMKGFVK